MHNAWIRYFVFSWMLAFQATITYAQTSRQVEIKVFDEQDQPLADASVLIRPALNARALSDELSFRDKPPATPHTLVTTDASGVVTVDVSPLLGEDADAPVSVAVWKLGYGLQSTTVQKKVELKCWPVRKRTVQIVDWQDKPVKGLRVDHASPMETSLENTKIRWWKDEAVVTDEFGLATLETHAGGQLQLAITEPDGTLHRAAVNDINRFSGRTPDLRDLQVIRLTPHGKVEGNLPAEFAENFNVRIERDYRLNAARPASATTGFESQSQVDADGHFRFDSVAEGWHWVIVYHKQPLASTTEIPQRQPVAVHHVDVQAGKTATVKVETAPVAKVTGRAVYSEGQGDLSELRLLISRVSSSDTDSRNPAAHNIYRLQCSRDGTFVCPLPVGRYVLSAVNDNKWQAANPVNFEVGAGAVSIATDDLRVTALKKVKVVWQRDHRWANSLLSVMDNRISFRVKDRHIGECGLTADGFGMAYLLSQEEPTAITRSNILPSSQPSNAFLDKDPSANFDLELIKTPQGLATNIAIRGRAVDADAKGIANLPVTIALTYESGNSTAGRSSIQVGSQLLDVVLTERDGSFQIPPRQLLSRMTIPGRATTDEAKFTFTISTPANPQPIEAQKVFTLKPEAWDVLEIEFPDLVVDRPLGGNRLSGKVMNADGGPSAGELVRLADKRRLVRTLSDKDGQFAIEDLAGPTWLLRESDWSVRAINDYSQPIVFDFLKVGAAGTEGGQGWQRLERAERIKLAKELIQAVPAQQGPLLMIPGRAAAMASDDFYFEPTKTFDQLLVMKGPNGDTLRAQFIDFWSDLSDEKARALANAMSQTYSRLQLQLMLADRRPNAEAYEAIMESIEYPSGAGRNPMARQAFDVLANVGVKLHLYGALEPHRAKIRQFLEQYASEMARTPANPPPNQPNPLNARAWVPEELGSLPLCRALLDPEQFASNLLDGLQISNTELSNEERAAQMRDVSIYLQLFPARFDQLPPDRLALTDGAMQNLGAQAPLLALEAIKQGKLGTEYLRAMATSALISGHPDAAEFFIESNKLLLKTDSIRPRVSFGIFNTRNRQPDVVWYEAAKQTSPEFGRMAAWQLAYEYLSGKYEDNTVTILPMRERYHLQMLSSAYCMKDDYPHLAQQIAQRAIPRLIASTEQEFGQTFGRGGDFSLAAWFDPRTACEAVIKLQKRLDEEQKNQPAGQRDTRLYSKQNELAMLRMTCLRGLLVEEL